MAQMFDAIFEELRRDAGRPWLRRTSGGLYAAVVLAAGASMVIIELLRG